jgi:hypothetical protein
MGGVLVVVDMIQVGVAVDGTGEPISESWQAVNNNRNSQYRII